MFQEAAAAPPTVGMLLPPGGSGIHVRPPLAPSGKTNLWFGEGFRGAPARGVREHKEHGCCDGGWCKHRRALVLALCLNL